MKILYVHFRPARTEAQNKAINDKVKLLKEVRVKRFFPLANNIEGLCKNIFRWGTEEIKLVGSAL